MNILEKITEAELDFIEEFFYPPATAEILFHDFDNFGSFHKTKFGSLRHYQFGMTSFEPMIDYEAYTELDEKEKFEMRQRVGDLLNVGARKSGKTVITLRLDIILSILNDDGFPCALYALDEKRIRGVLSYVEKACEFHPVIKEWEVNAKWHPIEFSSQKTGWKLDGINLTLKGKDPACYDDQTEILTDSGWEYFKDLTYNDKVLSMDLKTNIAKYYKINKIFKYNYKGNLKVLKNNSGCFKVTPEHRLLYENRGKRFFKKINEGLPKQISCPSTFIWKGKQQKKFKLSGLSNHRNVSFECKMEDWIAFVAWYLAEGCLVKSSDKHYKITIAQKKNYLEIENILKKLNLYYGVCKIKNGTNCYDINNKLIYKHLEKYFGRTKTKKIPKYIKNLCREYLEIFVRNYVITDGNSYKGSEYLATSVKGLADDLQEVVQKAGYKTSLRISNQDIEFNGYKYNKTIYLIGVLKSKTTYFQRDNIYDESYNGIVYCVDVNPFHNVFVRRKSIVMWSGNSNWYQVHARKIWGEEVSFETRKCYEKRIEAVSELGAIFRLAGMTDFTKHSVIGKQFYSWLKKGKSLNLPQCVSPYWTEKEKAERIEAYNGEGALNYKIYVEGKIVEDIVNELDMGRVEEACYKRKEFIKRFEIDKEKFNYYQNIIIVERPKNAERIFITSDVGDNQSEILIHAEINNKYKYLYNITLYHLIGDEQEEVLKFLIKELQANVIGIDCGDHLGRGLCDHFERDYSKETVVRYMGQSKFEVDFEYDDKNKIVYKDGKPVYRKELMSQYSVYLLKNNLYKGRHIIPFDGRLDEQLGNLVSRFIGNGKSTQCASEDDHLFNAWKVLEIAIFLKKDFNKTLPMEEENPIGVMGFI